MATGQFPFSFPVGPIHVPPEVARVEGCDCGGLEYHRDSCSIFALGSAERLAAVDAAQARLREYTATLNTRLALDSTVVRSGGGGYEAGGAPVTLPHSFGSGETFQLWAKDDGEAAEMADIVRECCQRFRPDLVGQLAATPDGAAFTVRSAMTGRLYRVSVTEES